MKYFNKFYFVLLFVSLIFASCSGEKKDSKPETTPQTQSEVKSENNSTTTDAANKKLYEAKSGIVIYDADIMGMKTTQEYYFDDYGQVECRKTKVDIEIMKQKSSTTTCELKKDGWVYRWEEGKQIGTKSKAIQSLGKVKGMPELENMSKEMMDKYKYKDLGEKEVQGKMCKGVSMDVMGMQIEAWTYNGILVLSKVWMQKDKEPMIMKAVKFEMGANVPSSLMTIPTNVKFTES